MHWHPATMVSCQVFSQFTLQALCAGMTTTHCTTHRVRTTHGMQRLTVQPRCEDDSRRDSHGATHGATTARGRLMVRNDMARNDTARNHGERMTHRATT